MPAKVQNYQSQVAKGLFIWVRLKEFESAEILSSLKLSD